METIQDLLRDETGALNPAYIKGSMSLDGIANAFNIPIEAFIEHFNLPEDIDKWASLKDIADTHNIRMRNFRDFVAAYVQQGSSQ